MADLPEQAGLQPAATFPDEPFACPNCGQMLAPSVRVCPSCKQTVDPSEIVRPAVNMVIAEQVVPLPAKVYARFSWRTFFIVLVVLWAEAVVFVAVLGFERSVLLFAAIPVGCSMWVLYDARQKGIPKPARWALGSILPAVWIFIFAWYLSRRKTPHAASPFMEGERGRIFLLIMLVALLVSMLLALIKGPPNPSPGGKTPGTHGTATPVGKIAGVTHSISVQAPPSAPSEASQT